MSASIASEAEFDFGDKFILCKNPIAKFTDLNTLNEFINSRTFTENAGFAGYISYEGDLEFVVFEEINIQPSLKSSQKAPSIQGAIYKPSKSQFIDCINKCKEYIREGDIYQANLSQKFTIQSQNPTREVYAKLKLSNPNTYMGFLDYSKYQILSSSPESFLKIYPKNSKWYIESSPIKGTAKLNHKSDLELSEKEKAEHIMILDLIRNDLNRICKTGSVQVSKSLNIERCSNLYHLISTVEGELKELDFPQIFAAMFPGGSITGAPKIRAMEIIKKLEPCPRGPYTGSMGYFRFKDGGEFNILIRTLIYNKFEQEFSFHSGAGITADSEPDKEYEEILLKAQKLFEVFDGN